MTQRTRRDFLRLGAGAAAGSLVAASGLPLAALADTRFPQKPITIVEPWGPQSWGFLQAQELAVALEPILGQRVIVTAKSGGASALGTRFVKEARPDGYTLLHAWIAGFVMVPLQDSNTGYDVFKDFDFLSYFTESPVVAVSRADRPWNTLAEMVKHIRANPDKNYAFSGGPALSIHSISGAEVFENAGVKVRGIFYDDAAAAGAAMFSGDVDVAMDGFGALRRYGDKVKAIGVFSNRRYRGHENVSTVAEQGLKAPSVRSWSGLVAPKGLPDEVRAKLSQALKRVIGNREFQDKIYNNMQWFVEYKEPGEFREIITDSLKQMQSPVARVRERQKQK